MQTFGLGARGYLVKVYQEGLQRGIGRRLENGGADGKFGDATAKGTIEFANGVKASDPQLFARLQYERALFGQAGPSMWQALDLAWPELFARCLQLTAGFEGTGFTGSCGPKDTGDTAGVTFGLVGFTSFNGELQELLRKAREKAPLAFEQVGCKVLGVMPYTMMLKLIGADTDNHGQARTNTDRHGQTQTKIDNREFERWALRGGKVTLSVQAWLAALGQFDWFRRMQMEAAFERYWSIASRQVGQLFATPASDRCYALMFDIAVQNGGLRSQEVDDLVQMFARGYDETETDRMGKINTVLIDRLRRKKRPSRIIDDVRSRKNCIATGSGVVHGDTWVVRRFAL